MSNVTHGPLVFNVDIFEQTLRKVSTELKSTDGKPLQIYVRLKIPCLLEIKIRFICESGRFGRPLGYLGFRLFV